MQYDAIIVGARIAGSILGCLLGKSGRRILVLDRARFPSDTLSTHFFRAPALRAFDDIGVLEAIEATAPRLTVNHNAIDDVEFPEPVDRPEDFPYYLNVRRITLDSILVQRLKHTPGVQLIEGALVNSLVWDGEAVAGVGWKDEDGVHEARARAVVGADGVHSFVARQVDAATAEETPVHRAMYYGYFENMQPKEGPAAEFHYRGNRIAYVMPTDGDLSLLAISVPIEEFQVFKRDPRGSLLRSLKEMKHIAPRLDAATLSSRVMGSGSIPCIKRVPFGPGWALVGDAGMTLDPWSGQGIDLASAHARFLAQHLAVFFSGQADWETAMRAYHRERDEFSEKPYRRTATFAPDLRPMTAAALAKRGLS